MANVQTSSFRFNCPIVLSVMGAFFLCGCHAQQQGKNDDAPCRLGITPNSGSTNITDEFGISTTNVLLRSAYEVCWQGEEEWREIGSIQGASMHRMFLSLHPSEEGGDPPPFVCHFRYVPKDEGEFLEIGICVGMQLVVKGESYFTLSHGDAERLQRILLDIKGHWGQEQPTRLRSSR